MRFRRTSEATCKRKVQYDTARAAKRAAHHLRGFRWPYRCNVCGKFHLTSNSPIK
jgi:hypothetical protein